MVLKSVVTSDNDIIYDVLSKAIKHKGVVKSVKLFGYTD